jgi:hypothetical protein
LSPSSRIVEQCRYSNPKGSNPDVQGCRCSRPSVAFAALVYPVRRECCERRMRRSNHPLRHFSFGNWWPIPNWMSLHNCLSAFTRVVSSFGRSRISVTVRAKIPQAQNSNTNLLGLEWERENRINNSGLR